MKNRSIQIQKVRELANRGVDGEKENAKRILKKLLDANPDEEPIIVDAYNVNGKGKETFAASYKQYTKIMDIQLGYQQFVTSNEVWRGVCTVAREVIEQITGTHTVQNWEDKITCRCYPITVPDIHRAVNDAIYNYLVSIDVPVIHFGGDKAGFGVEDTSMENGKADGIFQYQVCDQFEAPNRDAEIKAAMAYPQYNRFVAMTANGPVWGAITAYDKKAGTITLTPLNPLFPANILRNEDIKRLFRVEAKGFWYFGDENELVRAAKARKAAAQGDR